MTASLIWNKISETAAKVQSMMEAVGERYTDPVIEKYNWENHVYISSRYRRAHVEIVDQREENKLYILHCTIFPHTNDPSPIWGFDAVCGPNKITGAFLDYSAAGDADHSMMKWFAEETANTSWNKPRQLPEWAQAIFSPAMVAAGNVQEETELNNFCDLALRSLEYYLENVGKTQQDVATYEMAQDRYCRYQKQNPHVVRSMVSMGFSEETIKAFVQEVLFPEIG